MTTKYQAALLSMAYMYQTAAKQPDNTSIQRDIATMEANIRYTFGDEEAEAIFARAHQRAKDDPV